MLAWWQAVVLGLVEGITEYLPVSSTGHLILTSSLLHLDHPDTKDALDAYLVVIQGGAILAVVFLYWERIVQMVRGVLGRDPDGVRLVANLVLAFLPAAVAGLLLHKTIKAVLFSDWPVVAALALGGLWMIWLGGRRAGGKRDVTAISWQTALGIGLFQTLALWPGTSRSMVTIGGGMLLGLSAVAAAEFSFLLGLPTLGAACVHDLAGNLRHGGPSMFQQLGAAPMALGFVVATVAAVIAVRWLVSFLTRHGLAPFGWYRLVLSAAFAALIIAGVAG
ncbi:MAG TPA: undecaprenyl-diphosphate phosphatase [Candidatus Binatia bacterium]|nr:undecaprenyl-diphosphate phosphatase [Candidatus Binatia bacterium]